MAGMTWIQLALAAGAIVAPVIALAGVVVTARNARRQIDAAAGAIDKQLAGAAANVDRQIKASVISASRQRWIEALRDDIAEFLTRHESVRFHDTLAAPTAAEAARAQEAVERRALVAQRIELRLNPGEEAHRSLVRNLRALKRSKEVFSQDPLVAKVADQTHDILRTESERVERGA